MAAPWLWLLLFGTGAAASVTFVQPASASLEAEHQVIGGAGLDIDFCLESPSGRRLVSEYRRSNGGHSSSSISGKLLRVELLLEEEEEGDTWQRWTSGSRPSRSPPPGACGGARGAAADAAPCPLQEPRLGLGTLGVAASLALVALVALVALLALVAPLRVRLLKRIFHDKWTGRT